MVITGARAVLVEERPDCGGLQIIEYVRLLIAQHRFHLSRLRSPEPFVDDIHGEATLLAPKNRSWQKSLTNFAVQPFPRAIAHLKGRGESFTVLDDLLVQVRHANLQAVS